MISALINLQVTDLLEESERRLQAADVHSVEDVRNHPEPLVAVSSEMTRQDDQLGDFLEAHLYHHYRVERMHHKAQRCICDLFEAFVQDPSQLPPQVRAYIDEEGAPRAICDYIAAMTDRFALSEHSKLFNLHERV